MNNSRSSGVGRGQFFGSEYDQTRYALQHIFIHMRSSRICGASGQEAQQSEEIALICSAYSRRPSVRGEGCITPISCPSEQKQLVFEQIRLRCWLARG